MEVWCQLGLRGWPGGVSRDCGVHCRMMDNASWITTRSECLTSTRACPGTAGAPQIPGTIPSLTPSRTAAPPFPPQPHFFRAASKSCESCRFPALPPQLTALSCALVLAHAGSNVRDAGLQTSKERCSAQPAPPAWPAHPPATRLARWGMLLEPRCLLCSLQEILFSFSIKKKKELCCPLDCPGNIK